MALSPELVGAAFAAFGGSQLVVKVLGPSAEYLGEGLKDVLAKRQSNTQRILENAEKKLGDNPSENESVPPRVVKEIIDEGSFCDDEIAVEYFGGALASSRTDSRRDDRSLVMMKLISRLSTFQLRTHYMFYSAIRHKLMGQEINFESGNEFQKVKLFIPMTAYLNGLGLSENDFAKINAIISHVFAGLYREGLIRNYAYGYTAADVDVNSDKKIDQPGMYIVPTTVGVELFLSAHGLACLNPGKFLTAEVEMENIESINLDVDSCLLL